MFRKKLLFIVMVLSATVGSAKEPALLAKMREERLNLWLESLSVEERKFAESMPAGTKEKLYKEWYEDLRSKGLRPKNASIAKKGGPFNDPQWNELFFSSQQERVDAEKKRLARKEVSKRLREQAEERVIWKYEWINGKIYRYRFDKKGLVVFDNPR